MPEEKPDSNFELFVIPKNKITPIKIEDAVAYFLKNYVNKYCKFETYRNYRSIFNFNILPYLKGKFLNNIETGEIKSVYNACKMKGLKPRRIKNTMALLNQLIKYYQNLGIIEKTCNFQRTYVYLRQKISCRDWNGTRTFPQDFILLEKRIQVG